MLIIPAIDLKDNKVVRYTRGITDKKVYSPDPIAVALEWKKQGAKFLHLVDLDGAMSGRQKNLAIIKEIIRKVKIPVQVGGGIRTLSSIRKLLGHRAKRVILSTRAMEDPGFLESAVKEFGREKIAVALDGRGNDLMAYGWKKKSRVSLSEFLERLEFLRVKRIIYTDTSRDGTLKGINETSIKRVLTAGGFKLIVSGGISSLKDIRKLKKIGNSSLEAVIIGKALYENRFFLKDAIKAAQGGILSGKDYKGRGK